MTKKIIWRLKEQPSVESLQSLVKEGILTKDEAREILFSEEEQIERNKKDLEEEIKFLRGLVEKLSDNQRQVIVEKIREVEVPVQKYPWYEPYKRWCNSSLGTSGTMNYSSGGVQAFKDIKTF